MKEIFTMWRHTNMIVLVALSAAMYAALLIPFQSIPIIPGHVSLRVASILPVALALLFGPAGAWGAGIGNLIGDFFGTLSPGAIGGFFANFITAVITYKIWNALSPLKNMSIDLNSVGRVIRYQVAVLVQASATVLILTWWVALFLGLAPAEVYFVAVLAGPWLAAALITPFILRIIYPRIRKWGLLWTDIMAPEEVSSGKFRKVGFVLTAAGSLVGVGALATVLYFLDYSSTDTFVRFLPVPFLIILLIGTLLMGGREQVLAMQHERREKSASMRMKDKPPNGT